MLQSLSLEADPSATSQSINQSIVALSSRANRRFSWDMTVNYDGRQAMYKISFSFCKVKLHCSTV